MPQMFPLHYVLNKYNIVLAALWRTSIPPCIFIALCVCVCVWVEPTEDETEKNEWEQGLRQCCVPINWSVFVHLIQFI